MRKLKRQLVYKKKVNVKKNYKGNLIRNFAKPKSTPGFNPILANVREVVKPRCDLQRA